jgi:ATP-dependent RNA helicase RhlE
LSASASIPSNGFDHFEFHDTVARGVVAAGFDSPRPIQEQTIPAGLEGRDVMGLAQTGTGKTAAFALPILDQLMDERRPGPRALIVAPTRELATQIAEEIRLLAKYTKLEMVTLFGGVSLRGQANALRRGPEIVVGCPGRILDLLGQRILHLDEVETLVLDEADHMFDMGFLPDIRRILAALPKERQTMLFSATMPKEIRRLADDVLHKPHVVELAHSAPAETIDHGLYLVAESRKRELLDHLLAGDDCESAIVFTRTKHRARRLAEQLTKAGHKAVGLQGNLSQNQRDRAMQGFRSGRYEILVATDIVARGIDVSGVSHVINFDVPNTPEAYTHRIGRTGRSENEGIACTFVTRDDRTWLRATERMIGSDIPRREVDGFIHDTEDQRGSGGGGGNAPGRGARKPRNARSSDGGNANRPQRRKPRSSGRGRSSGGGDQPRTR